MGLFSPLTDALGFTGQKTPTLVAPEKIKQFDSPFGTATSTGYTSNLADPNAALAKQKLTQQLSGLAPTDLSGIAGPNIDQSSLQATPEQIAGFQEALRSSMLTPLEQQLQQRGEQAAIKSSTGGTAGSSADLYKQSLINQEGDLARANIENQAVMGGQQLANQLFGQNLAGSQNKFGQELGAGQFDLDKAQAGFGQNVDLANLFSGVGQQDFLNQINAFGATQNALQGGQQSALGYANALNQNELATVAAQNAAKTAGMKNLIGAGVAGTGVYNAFK